MSLSSVLRPRERHLEHEIPRSDHGHQDQKKEKTLKSISFSSKNRQGHGHQDERVASTCCTPTDPESDPSRMVKNEDSDRRQIPLGFLYDSLKNGAVSGPGKPGTGLGDFGSRPEQVLRRTWNEANETTTMTTTDVADDDDSR